MRERPPKVIRGAEDVEDHGRKGRPLGITAEDHARLTWLFIHREATAADFRGMLGAPLAARIDEVWRLGREPVAAKETQAS